jgi:hypothetical protein
MAQERLGEVLEDLGEHGKAAEHYRAFAQAWVDADAEFQPRVSAARERSTYLSSEPTTAEGDG